MRNLNEPLRKESQGEVISMEDRQRSVERGQGLISKREMEDLKDRWTTIQASFVDDPKKAVSEADELVSSAIEQLAESFRGQRNQLEKGWRNEGQISTEDLRLAVQQYRTFFDRLLSL